LLSSLIPLFTMGFPVLKSFHVALSTAGANTS
jgi:hypothetical protein